MEIKVACTSSLFKENGHDLKGIFTLFYNAVYAYFSLATMNMHNICDQECCLVQLSDNRELVAGCILKTLETFQPDLEAAASRVSQFDREYKELKEISEKIKEVHFLTILTRADKKINAYIRRRKEIEEETISLKELLNVAFYKFTQVNGTRKQFKEGFERFLK